MHLSLAEPSLVSKNHSSHHVHRSYHPLAPVLMHHAIPSNFSRRKAARTSEAAPEDSVVWVEHNLASRRL
jgi:hypothetical protein